MLHLLYSLVARRCYFLYKTILEIETAKFRQESSLWLPLPFFDLVDLFSDYICTLEHPTFLCAY